MVSDGILLADKGPGVTSFQVVAHLRRVLRIPKVGHGGTLDPLATGLLPILLGEATKLTGHLQGQDKEYLATARLGVATDTLDATGAVTGERPVPALSAEQVRAVLDRFVGEIEQVPPMYSAIHAGGRRLHELARAGIAVERAPRRVRVHELELIECALPCLRVRVACGSGTYVRSLVADVGEALGCGGHVEALVRTRVGRMRLEDAVPWPVLQQGDAAALAGRVQPADRAVAHLPAVTLTPEAGRRLAHGQPVPPSELTTVDLGVAPTACRVYAAGEFLGIGELSAQGLRPRRLLHADRSRPRSISS
ncbi:MAG TPA: tRNA pseudouridine(55) synthase TruB [Methylomirabilota bacterium]|jgi:tRNA pseudouridine55 synthase|nr:tRNA pseudouridine(55) synthase TruB [Methylomirabilota bacterium]